MDRYLYNDNQDNNYDNIDIINNEDNDVENPYAVPGL